LKGKDVLAYINVEILLLPGATEEKHCSLQRNNNRDPEGDSNRVVDIVFDKVFDKYSS
jgi:hypothetical protein